MCVWDDEISWTQTREEEEEGFFCAESHSPELRQRERERERRREEGKMSSPPSFFLQASVHAKKHP